MKNETKKKLCYDDVAMKKMRMQRKKKKLGVMACTLKVMDDPLPTNVEFRTNHTILSYRQPVEVEQWWRRQRERKKSRERVSDVKCF